MSEEGKHCHPAKANMVRGRQLDIMLAS